MDRDYQKQPGPEHEEPPKPKSKPKSNASASDKPLKKGESLEAKSDKQERSIELKEMSIHSSNFPCGRCVSRILWATIAVISG